jgi:hypothetical protein
MSYNANGECRGTAGGAPARKITCLTATWYYGAQAERGKKNRSQAKLGNEPNKGTGFPACAFIY